MIILSLKFYTKFAISILNSSLQMFFMQAVDTFYLLIKFNATMYNQAG
jgi:hypothetical protein